MSKSTIDREDPRLELVGNQFVTVTIESDDNRAEPNTVAAQLLNLSAAGAKLSVPLDLPRDKSIRIKLTLEEFALTIYLSGTVCWAAKEGTQSSLIGCRLSPTIPTSILEHVARGGTLDRRDEDRRPTENIVDLLRRRAARGPAEQAELRNYASGGVCLELSQPAELGEHIRVRFRQSASKSAVQFDVVVRWQMQQSDHYLIGCEYADSQSFELVKTVVED